MNITDTHSSPSAVVMEIHQCACVAHPPFSCINEHSREMASPPDVVAAPTPLKLARNVSALPDFSRVTSTLQKVSLAA